MGRAAKQFAGRGKLLDEETWGQRPGVDLAISLEGA